MRFLSLALLPAVLGAALERRGESGHCAAGNPLSCAARFNGTPALRPNTKTVAALVEGYAQLIGNYTTALGQSYLAEGFTDTSGSINSLAGIPLTDVTFASKEAFMANQVGCLPAQAHAQDPRPKTQNRAEPKPAHRLARPQ